MRGTHDIVTATERAQTMCSENSDEEWWWHFSANLKGEKKFSKGT